MSNMTLTIEQYEALVALARVGVSGENSVRALDEFLQKIEAANSITRNMVWIQWMEQDQPLPPSAIFPTSWPPTQRYQLEQLTRPISKADVLQVLKVKARKPVTVLVTKDPGAVLGWTALDDFFPQ